MGFSPDTEEAALRLWDGLRSGWVADPTILVEQVSYLLMLKRLGRSGDGPHDWAGPMLRWGGLSELTDSELVDELDRSLIPFVAASMPSRVRRTMREARFALHDPMQLRSCIDAISQVDSESEGAFFEALVSRLDQRGDRLQARTPPAVAKAMVDLARPGIGDRICDPAVGNGGLLLEAARQVGARYGTSDVGLYGYDIDPSKVRLAAFNLAFHDVPDAQIEQRDVLAADFPPGVEFDVVVCSPPFGGAREESEIDEELAGAGRRTEVLYLERCLHMQRARAAILIPESILFGRAGPIVRARQEWLQRSRVLGVVLLPPGLLGFTNIRTAILVASREGTTRDVWYCPIGEEVARASVAEQLACVGEALHAKQGGVGRLSTGADELTAAMFSASIDEIAAYDWSLAPALYRETDTSEALGDPVSILDDVMAAESEIGRHLTEARRLLAEQ